MLSIAVAPTQNSNSATLTEAPTCPKCGSPMARRIAKQGANAGQAFYGCSTYPRCRGTMPAS
ncbi:topoisomerase DNA-binding C4 zinc finger domain-containing protein [uncultured Nevskia sp.]|uniref:topoisomerase DNA-binding C4 zinc finger domain-containing protein n=1 Tax=uncultured Nevskia sp. TaxID=228950 RepID=UPI0025DAAA0D|nr:topoisomerase DNA-binding C4 zinc finger domain-containing protein [uncultured Nevskia sp.]